METLIINKRHELPKSKRIIWDIVTLLLWLGFIYLWKPLILVFYRIITLEVPADEIADWIFNNISSVTFEHAVFVLLTTPIVLFILSRLHRHQAPSEHLTYDFSDYADYFGVDNIVLQECVYGQYITVYHDEYGHIIHVNNHISKDT
ncbi:MAG: poly-beta-1,6-N-acetyl-D-glucosamine biosynthesis protein PgaD [Sulfuricurvum sp.]|nr:poly-beta-1,6-N-acetyl-D-glucosamine biosynthesis protein PgaD [Sulfuricurvum sp.]